MQRFKIYNINDITKKYDEVENKEGFNFCLIYKDDFKFSMKTQTFSMANFSKIKDIGDTAIFSDKQGEEYYFLFKDQMEGFVKFDNENGKSIDFTKIATSDFIIIMIAYLIFHAEVEQEKKSKKPS